MITPPVFLIALPWVPESHWVAGTYDPAYLSVSLRGQAQLADFVDASGNRQSRVRLDADIDPTNVGWWVTVPAGTGQAPVDAGVAGYQAVADAAAQKAAADATASANHSALDNALQTRMDQLRQARTALAAGTLFASLGTNEKKTIDALLQDDIQICRLLLDLLDATG